MYSLIIPARAIALQAFFVSVIGSVARRVSVNTGWWGGACAVFHRPRGTFVTRAWVSAFAVKERYTRKMRKRWMVKRTLFHQYPLTHNQQPTT